MLVRIPLLILLLGLISGTASLATEKFTQQIWLAENPLQRANVLLAEGRMDEVLYLVQFSKQYLSADPEFSGIAIEDEAHQTLDSYWYLLERFVAGALTGEVRDMPGLVGSMTLDMLVIGDIRDLLVQGYKEFDTGQGDEVVMTLSATGLLLTFAPELSWAPSVFKSFWRGKRFSAPFQKLMRKAVAEARRTGDYRHLRKMISQFSDTVDSLGAGPAMAIFKRVESAEDMTLLASKAKIAPAEAYTLSSINGIKSLENISITGAKQGKMIKRVKLASRQQKLFGKALALIPLFWLIAAFGLFSLLFISLIVKGRKQKV